MQKESKIHRARCFSRRSEISSSPFSSSDFLFHYLPYYSKEYSTIRFNCNDFIEVTELFYAFLTVAYERINRGIKPNPFFLLLHALFLELSSHTLLYFFLISHQLMTGYFQILFFFPELVSVLHKLPGLSLFSFPNSEYSF